MAIAKGTEGANVPSITIRELTFTVVGDSPLIMHAWSEKAKAMIRDKQQKKAAKGREVRNPEAECKDALHTMPDGSPGFPSVAFKSAAVDACSTLAGITKVVTRMAFHVIGDMVPIKGDWAMREDMVRVGMGAADLRYRPEFKEWSADIRIRYNPLVLSAEQIVNLFNLAGFGGGVGEWRPQRDGSNGMFHVDPDSVKA
jgi:hypothetical protein